MEKKKSIDASSAKLKIDHKWSSNKSLNSINPEVSYGGFVVTNEYWHQEPIYSSFSRLYFVMEGS